VNARYENEAKLVKERGRKDAEIIAKKVQGLKEYDVVMRQTVSNVQGADVLVLKKRKECVVLDLYQAKNYKKPRSRASVETKSAFASLGVEYVDKGIVEEIELNTSPDTGSAGYSYLRTMRFIDELIDHLCVNVKLGDRVVVFSCEWELFRNSRTWKYFPFKDASEKKVFVWSKEMLEPTISALVVAEPIPPDVVGDEDEAGDDDQHGDDDDGGKTNALGDAKKRKRSTGGMKA